MLLAHRVVTGVPGVVVYLVAAALLLARSVSRSAPPLVRLGARVVVVLALGLCASLLLGVLHGDAAGQSAFWRRADTHAWMGRCGYPLALAAWLVRRHGWITCSRRWIALCPLAVSVWLFAEAAPQLHFGPYM